MGIKAKYWLICTSPENFQVDRAANFTVEGFKPSQRRTVQKVRPGDKFVYYINKLQRLGAISVATTGYYHDETKVWVEEDELWPCRFKIKPEIILPEDQMLDVKGLVPGLSFITDKQKQTNWGLAFHQSLRTIPEEDFALIESEMRKILVKPTPGGIASVRESEAKKKVMGLPLQAKSLHDRLGEMLQSIGTWMGYNSITRHKVTPEHAIELDVAWLQGKNPEVAIEVQIGGNLTEAKDRLSQAKKFNYRKVIIVIEEGQLDRLNALLKFDELRPWLDAWSIGAVYRLYTSGESFFDLYDRLQESRYRERTAVEFVK